MQYYYSLRLNTVKVVKIYNNKWMNSIAMKSTDKFGDITIHDNTKNDSPRLN